MILKDNGHGNTLDLGAKPCQSKWEAYMSQFQDTAAEASADQK